MKKKCEERLDGGSGVYDKECGRPAIVKERLMGRGLDKWLCKVHARTTANRLLKMDLKEANSEIKGLHQQMADMKRWIKSIKNEVARLRKASK